MKKLFIIVTFIYLASLFIYGMTNVFLQQYSSHKIVSSNKKLDALNDKEIVYLTYENDGYYALSKDSYFYKIDDKTFKELFKIKLLGLHNPYAFKINHNKQLTILDKENGNNYLSSYNLTHDRKSYSQNSRKLVDREWIRIHYLKIHHNQGWNKTVGSKYHYPFDKTLTKEWSIAKGGIWGDIIIDRKRKLVEVVHHGNCYGDLKELYTASILLDKVPLAATYNHGMCWSGNYHIMPKSNYWGDVVISFKDEKGAWVYKIRNTIGTMFLHEINKITGYIKYAPLWPLSLFYGKQ